MNKYEKFVRELINELKNEIAQLKNLNQNMVDSNSSNSKIDESTKHQSNLGDWVQEKEAMNLLKIKKTALYYLRRDGKVRATPTRPIFYSKESLINYLTNISKS